MNIKQLIQMTPQDAMRWLKENQHTHSLVPLKLTPDIREEYHQALGMFEDGKGTMPDLAWQAMLNQIDGLPRPSE